MLSRRRWQCKLLVQHKADILHKNKNDRTAFHYASSSQTSGHSDVLKYLTSSLVPVLRRLKEAWDLDNATARWILDPTDEKPSPLDSTAAERSPPHPGTE